MVIVLCEEHESCSRGSSLVWIYPSWRLWGGLRARSRMTQPENRRCQQEIEESERRKSTDADDET
jgi:hypothetical protein